MSAAYSIANQQARNLVACLKSGTLLKGAVRSVDETMDIAWISLDFPDLDERQVPVKGADHVRVGDNVMVQCIPDPARPEHYVFRMTCAAA
jgi:hypothetical protein